MPDLERAAFATRTSYSALGANSERLAGGALITAADWPDVWEANLLAGPTASDPASIDQMLADLARRHVGVDRLRVVMGPDTPALVEARLAAADWSLDLELQLVLSGPLLVHPPEVEIRAAVDGADWASLLQLFRADHEEEAERAGRRPFPLAVTRQIVESKRAKTPALAVWIASVDGVDVGFFSSWPGVWGLGMVEDLFTLPAYRGQGVASALLAQGVDDVRARGATAVLICALVDDTPRRAYRRMGFEPVRLGRSWRRAPEQG